mgnify:CR=1 FL=1
MKWQDYEFDEAYRPSGFEEWSQEKVNVGYAFYLRDKYITDDTGLYEDTDEGTIHINAIAEARCDCKHPARGRENASIPANF